MLTAQGVMPLNTTAVAAQIVQQMPSLLTRTAPTPPTVLIVREFTRPLTRSALTRRSCYDRGGFPGDTLDRVRQYEVNAQELVMTSSTRLLMTT